MPHPLLTRTCTVEVHDPPWVPVHPSFRAFEPRSSPITCYIMLYLRLLYDSTCFHLRFNVTTSPPLSCPRALFQRADEVGFM